MIKLLYIGNKLSGKGKTITTIDSLTKHLSGEGFLVNAVSNKTNKVWRLFDMLSAVVKYSRTTDYVLIDTYSTSNFYYAYLCSQLCRLFKLKYIPILHGGNLPARLKNNPKLSRAVFNNAHVNIAPSNYTKSEFEALGYSNLTCIPNAIDINNYIFQDKTYDRIKLLWVRSFSALYNPFLAIDVLAELQQKGIDSELTMVGPDNDGTLEQVKAYAKSRAVDVQFTGLLSKADWIAMAADYNVFINTTNFDNMPVSVIEAMALGLVVLSTNVGGLPFLIADGEDGVLLAPNDAGAFVKSIINLQKHYETTSNMTRLARKKVEEYNWDAVKIKWQTILK